MSSVQDRIRSLQRERERAESSSAPVASVQSRARAVDNAEKQPTPSSATGERSLSQLASRFDGADDGAQARALSGRVAQFDGGVGGDSVQMRMRRLESDAHTGSVAGRAAAFETERGQIGSAAARFSQTEEEEDSSAAEALRKARARFEASATDGGARRETSFVPTPSAPTPSAQTPSAQTPSVAVPRAPTNGASAQGESDRKNVSSRAAMFEKGEDGKGESGAAIVGRPTASLVSFGSDDSATVTNEQVSRRAAAFEHENGAEGKRSVVAQSAALFEKQRVVNVAKEGGESAHKSETTACTSAASAEAKRVKSVQEELREVKRANEQLLSTLLKLTASFRDLEKSRDQLQQKIAGMENK